MIGIRLENRPFLSIKMFLLAFFSPLSIFSNADPINWDKFLLFFYMKDIVGKKS
jgi:hypothetical protein